MGVAQVIFVAPWSANESYIFPLPVNSKAEAPDVLSETTQHESNVTDDYDDPNFDPTAFFLEDESPYPEVRSAVSNTDDPSMLSSTFRAWFLGLIWAALIPGVNQFFFFRYPSISIGKVRGFLVLRHFEPFFGRF